jgi:hypothetical protein
MHSGFADTTNRARWFVGDGLAEPLLAGHSVAVAIQSVRIAASHGYRSIDIARSVAGPARAVDVRSRRQVRAIALTVRGRR